MRLIAHRGFAAEYPENTLRAVRAAASRADAIEVDVRACATGEPVVIHDETVDRVTDATGPVDGFTPGELASLSVLGTDEGVPTLADVVDALPSDVGVNVDLKEPGLAAAVRRETRPLADVLVSSFSRAILDAVGDADPDVPLAYITAEPGGIGTARDLGCAAFHPHVGLCDADRVDRAHAAGLTVNAWTIAGRETAAALAERGVDGVIADAPDVLD